MYKILFVMPEFTYGGAERQITYLINGISKYADFDVNVLVYHSYNNNSTPKFENERITIFEARYNEIGKVSKIVNKMRFSKYIKKTFKKNEFDIIVIYSPLSLLCTKVFEKKCKHLVYLERNSGEKTLLRKYYYNMIKKIDNIITNSLSALELFSKSGFEKAICINNGIEIRESEVYSPKKILRALIPARIANIKNQKVIVENLDKISAKLILAGPIEDKKYFDELCLINKNLTNKFEYIGVVKNINDLYSNIDLVILPSISEGTPNVILEAFSNKKLCIASNIKMNSNLFEDNNLLFNPHDGDSFLKSFNYVDSLEECNICRLIERNHKYVKDEYSIEKMVQKYYSYFINLLIS